MKTLTKAVICLILIAIKPLCADNRIIIYLKHAPEQILSDVEREAKQTSLASKIEQIESASPGVTSQKMVKNALRAQLQPPLSGIIGIYGGYMDFSDLDGLLSFPLRHTTPKLYLAITPQINLINIKGNTYSHREFIVDPTNPAQLFSFELKQDEKQAWFWDVKEMPLPADKKINPLTVVILTQPKNIYVPQGQFLTTQNIQLITPDIYVLSRSSNEEAVLQSLNLRRFFEPINVEEKKVTDTTMQKIISNI